MRERIAGNAAHFRTVTNAQIQEVNTNQDKYEEIHTWVNHNKNATDQRKKEDYTSRVKSITHNRILMVIATAFSIPIKGTQNIME